MPFAYAEAGHLTHGYATTVHKSQGATVDHCFVLADETMTREHVYTALSRGRHGNDLFVVGDDPRVEERHAAELQRDALDAVRSVFGRSATKEMATDQTTPEVAQLHELRRERDSIRSRLGDGPPDRSWDYRQLSEAAARETYGRQGAQRRLDTARRSLQDLGPIGRRTHRNERRELERRIAGLETDITRHDQRLTDLEARLTELTPEMLTRATWERRHSPELDRLENLDRRITWNEGIERLVARELERGVERGLDLGHGIEL